MKAEYFIRVLAYGAMIGILAACSGGGGGGVDRAQEALKDRRYNEVIVLTKSALQKGEESAKARYLLGAALYHLGEFSGAEIELRKALNLKFERGLVVPLIAKSMLEQQKLKKLLDEFPEGVSLDDSAANADLRATQVLAFARMNQNDIALRLLKSELISSPNDANLLIAKARLAAGAGNSSDAISVVDLVLALYPDNISALLLKADIVLLSSPSVENAIELYKKAVALRGDSLQAHSALFSIYFNQRRTAEAKAAFLKIKGLAPNSVQTKYFEAQLAVLDGDLAKAREAALILLKIAPNDVRLLQFCGGVELQMGALADAEGRFSKVLSAEPGMSSVRRLLAQVYLRSGQPAKALTTLRPIVDGGGVNDGDSFVLAAEAYSQLGEHAQAQRFFERAAKLKPEDVKVKTAVALGMVLRGDVDRGFSDLISISSADKGVFADLALVNARMSRREWRLALEALDVLQRKMPEKPAVYDLRGRAFLGLGDSQAARNSFSLALEKDGQYFPSVAGLAALDEQVGRVREAKERIAEFLKRSPRNTSALLALADLKGRAGESKAEITPLLREAVLGSLSDPRVRIALISHLRMKNDLAGAMVAAQDAVAVLPNAAELHDAIGLIHMAKGDSNQALSSFGKVALLEPASPRPYERIAEVHLRRGDYENAMASLRRGLTVSPKSRELHFGLVSLMVRARRTEEALRMARSLQVQSPEDHFWFSVEGDIFFEQKKYMEAISAYSKGLKVSTPNKLPVKVYSSYFLAGSPREAERFAIEWLKGHPGDSDFIFHLADQALSKADYRVAEKYYRDVVRIDPKNAIALNNIAWVLFKRRDPAAARVAAEALALAPRNAAVLDTNAIIEAGLGNFGRAIDFSKRAVAASPEVKTYRLTLAKIYVQSGDKVSARSELSELSKLGRAFDSQREVQMLIQSLGE